MTDRQDQIEVDDEQEINLLELVQVPIRHKMLIIKMCSVAVVASVIYSLSLPNIYAATAKILPPQKDGGGGLSAVLGQMGGMGGLAALAGSGFTGSGELYLGICKSRSVEDAVIKRLDLMRVYKAKNMEVARALLEDAVKTQSGKDGIISITAKDADPKRAALLANTLVDELGKTTIRLNLSKAGTERLFLEKRLELVKKDLKSAEDELKSFAQSNRVVQVDAQAKASIEGIARLKADLALKEVQLAVLTSNQTEQSPEVKALRSGIDRMRGELGKLVGRDANDGGIPSIGNVPGLGLEYSRRLRELKSQEAIYEQLAKQYEVAKLNEAKDSSALQVLDEAVVPINRLSPKRSLIVIMATAATFLLAILSAFALEYFSKISSADKEALKNLKKQALAFK